MNSLYHLDIITTLLHLEENARDYKKKPNQMPEHWEDQVTFIFNVSYNYGFSDKTRELAVSLLKKTAIQDNANQDDNLWVVGLVCLSIAGKMEEAKLFGPQHVLLALRYSIDLDYVLQVEQSILQSLQWKLNVSTPIDLARSLLYLANDSYDFTNIIENVTNFIYLCLLDKELAVHSASVIAIASILSGLEYLKMNNFKIQLASFLQSQFPSVDYEAIIQCKTVLSQKVKQSQATADNSKVTCYDRDDKENNQYLSNKNNCQPSSYRDLALETIFGLHQNSKSQEGIREPFKQIQNTTVQAPASGHHKPTGSDANKLLPLIGDTQGYMSENNSILSLFSSFRAFEIEEKENELASEGVPNCHRHPLPSNTPHIFVPQIERYFMDNEQLNRFQAVATNSSGEVLESSFEDNMDPCMTLKYSIVTDEQNFYKEQDIFREIRSPKELGDSYLHQNGQGEICRSEQDQSHLNQQIEPNSSYAMARSFFQYKGQQQTNWNPPFEGTLKGSLLSYLTSSLIIPDEKQGNESLQPKVLHNQMFVHAYASSCRRQ